MARLVPSISVLVVVLAQLLQLLPAHAAETARIRNNNNQELTLMTAARALLGRGNRQLDVCDATGATSMALSVKAGMCHLSSRVLPGGAPSPAAPGAVGNALLLSFACDPAPEFASDGAPRLEGPALNVWAAADPPADAADGGAGGGGGGSEWAFGSMMASAGDTCRLTTLSPALYFKRPAPSDQQQQQQQQQSQEKDEAAAPPAPAPPLYYYGYALSGLPCRAGDLSRGAAKAADGSRLTAVTHGLFVVPELPGPSATAHDASVRFSAADQTCRLLVVANGKSHVSAASYPCRMQEQPERAMGGGQCFGGM